MRVSSGTGARTAAARSSINEFKVGGVSNSLWAQHKSLVNSYNSHKLAVQLLKEEE